MRQRPKANILAASIRTVKVRKPVLDAIELVVQYVIVVGHFQGSVVLPLGIRVDNDRVDSPLD